MVVCGSSRPPWTQRLARWGVGVGLVLAGVAHLTFARAEFQAQVPPWVPMVADHVVVLSGVAEVALGAALLGLPKQRRRIAALVAVFLIAVFPGNISQYVHGVDAFGLDTDRERFVRLFFQPLMCVVALHAGGLLSRRERRH